MRRRDFVTGIAGAAIAWPLDAHAQQSTLPVVAFINPGTPDSEARRLIAFRKGLAETGFVEGQNVTVEYHWLDGHYERLPALLADLTRRRVAVIAAPASTPAALAVKAANVTIRSAAKQSRVALDLRSFRSCCATRFCALPLRDFLRRGIAE